MSFNQYLKEKAGKVIHYDCLVAIYIKWLRKQYLVSDDFNIMCDIIESLPNIITAGFTVVGVPEYITFDSNTDSIRFNTIC